MSEAGRLVLAYPGDLETRTGGYVYDRRLALELEALGWRVERLSLPPGYPFPAWDELEETAAALDCVRAGATVLVDGLALGAMPEVAESQAKRLVLVALVHHPLCLETGLAASQAAQLRASEGRALAAVRHVIVTSPITARTLAELWGVAMDRITVAVPGTEPAPMARGSGGPGVRMVYVASISARKAHGLLIEALAGLAEHAWTLRCAGSLERDPATVARLRAAIAAAGLADRVELLGEVDEAGLAELYGTADLCVSASLYEGYGMALTEALARGLPIVAAAGGAVADTVPAEAGLLVPPGDAPALRDALRLFLTDPVCRARVTQGAQAARGRLPSWSDTARTVAGAVARVSA